MMIAPSAGTRQVYAQLRDRFNATHDDVRLRIIWTDIGQKMHLLTAADALPDIIVMADFNLVRYHGVLEDLGPYMARAPALQDAIYPVLLDACRYEGTLCLLPNFYNVPLLYYRPDVFAQARIDPPDASWTWDDFRAAAKALTVRDESGHVAQWGTNMTLGWWVQWLGLVRQAGGDLMGERGGLRIGEPATREALSFMHAILQEDHSAPMPIEAPIGGISSGRYAMFYGGHVLEWLTLRKNADFEWDIAPLPAGPAGRSTGELAVLGWGVWNKSLHKDAAWSVLCFMAGRQAGQIMADAGMVPVRRDVAEEVFLAGSPGTRAAAPQHREALIETLSFARSVPKHEHFSSLAQGYINPIIQAAVLNPDPTPLRDIHTRLEAQSRGYLNTLGTKPRAGVGWFVVECAVLITLLAAVVYWSQRRKAHRHENRGGEEKWFFIFISPWVLGMLLLFLGPMAVSFFWAHTSFNLVDELRFVGLAQFVSLFTEDPYFWHSLKITFIYALLAVPTSLAVALWTALLLNASTPGIGFFRTLFYLPSILPVAASGMMWAWFLNPQWGLINRLLELLSVDGPGWLHDPNWALPSLAIIATWGFGAPMLIFLAGLKTIPIQLYEAAGIDGAGPVKRFIHVTLPTLSPVVFFNLTMGIIGSMQIFDIAYVLGAAGPGLGEPQKSTYFYVLNLYEKSFVHLKLGLGSAMAWVLFVVILAMTMVNFGVKKLWVYSPNE